MFHLVSNQLSLDIAIQNNGASAIITPLTAVSANISQISISVANADGGGSGVGAFFDYSNFVGGDGSLNISESTSYRR